MYRQKGAARGIRYAVRFFLGVDIEVITALAATALVLGESELGDDWGLGPSERFARYAFEGKASGSSNRTSVDSYARSSRT